MGQWKESAWFSRIVIAVTIILAFGSSFFFPLLFWDDQQHICRNGVFALSWWEGLQQIWSQPYFGLYAPLSYTLWDGVIAIAKKMAGPACADWSQALHATNLILHIINSLLVFELLKTLWKYSTRSREGGAENRELKTATFTIATLVYALHPLQTESVAWISSARDLLMITMGLTGLLCWLKQRWKTATLFFALSMLAKPSGVSFILLAGLVSFRDINPRVLIPRLAPSFIVAAIITFIAKSIQSDSLLNFELAWWERPILYLHSIGFAIWKIILPMDLVPDRGRSIFAMQANPHLYWPALIAIAAIAGVLLYKNKHLRFALIWMAISILPVSGLIPFGFQEISTVADRYFGLALVAVAYLIVFATTSVMKGSPFAVKILVLLCFLGSLLATTKWKSDQDLFRANLEVFPESGIAHSNLANILFVQGKFAEAELEYRAAIKYNSRDLTARLGIGQTLEKLGRPSEAEAAYEEALRDGKVTPEIVNNLAVLTYQRDDLAKTERLWKQAASMNLNYFEPRYNLGQLYIRTSRLNEARAAFEDALRVHPDDARAKAMLEYVKTRNSSPSK